ncbi:MAG: hypothetical protein R3191_06710 [Anaerolineales bacterium]|nr:hypothetical protein [Anaerolineales bacterium]
MRGQRAALPPRDVKLDVLVTAARYDSETGELKMAQGYEPMGYVWSDIRLYSREELIQRIRDGQKIAYGDDVRLATDFEVRGEVTLVERDGDEILLAEGEAGGTDDLGVPRF